MGATHFLMRRLGKVSTEMALSVLAYNMKRVIAIVGVNVLLAALY
jgi:transposase